VSLLCVVAPRLRARSGAFARRSTGFVLSQHKLALMVALAGQMPRGNAIPATVAQALRALVLTQHKVFRATTSERAGLGRAGAV
jgi:hypothetical protein